MKEIDITLLLPQRPPILLVDELLRVEGEEAETCFTLPPDQLFVNESGWMEESGVIEHIAQSASALFGYQARQSGRTTPPIGYLGEVKHFRCIRLPQVGETLRTVIRVKAEVGDMILLTGETRVDGQPVATCELKICIER